MSHRSSTGDLGYHDDEPRRSRPAERWDREKFERYRSRGPEDRETIRFQSKDRSGGGRQRRNTDFELDEQDRGGRIRVQVREREYEDERPSRRRPEFLDREEPTPSEIANKALAPFRRPSAASREPGPPARRPARPHFVRRQSSLDTYDRKPLPRYGDYERDEWRPPTNVPIPLPIRERRTGPRSSHRDREDDFEEIRYKDLEPDAHDDYREIEIRRERSMHRRRRRSTRSKRAPSVSSASSSDSTSIAAPPSVHAPPPCLPGKRGRTRMPKRLVHKNALVQKGYEFEEEDDFLIVTRALEKTQIDEVIKISEEFKESRVTYVYDNPGPQDPPPPPEPLPPAGSFHGPPAPQSVRSHHTHHTVHQAPPPPPSFHGSHHSHHTVHQAPPPPPEAFFPPPAPPPPASVHSHANIRTVSPPRTMFEERIEESNHIGGPVTVLVPRLRRGEREIREEIRTLEEERRVVRLERENDYEFVERERPRDVIRVEKDRKGRLALQKRAPNNAILGAMVSTLT